MLFELRCRETDGLIQWRAKLSVLSPTNSFCKERGCGRTRIRTCRIYVMYFMVRGKAVHCQKAKCFWVYLHANQCLLDFQPISIVCLLPFLLFSLRIPVFFACMCIGGMPINWIFVVVCNETPRLIRAHIGFKNDTQCRAVVHSEAKRVVFSENALPYC